MRTSTISNKIKVLISAVSVRILWMLAVVLLGFGVAMAQNPKPVQTFYVPFPEDDVLAALKSITPSYSSGGTNYSPRDPMHAYLSIAVFAENTVIYYDQWENGFDDDIANPANIYSVSNPGGTQIWGDGDPSNGYPPGYPEDILSSGDIIHIHDDIVSAERGANIYYDGGDKIGSTKPIAVTKAAWASGSVTMFAVANEVYDTKFFGTAFRSPVGEDIPQTVDYQMFEYAGFMIMAGPEGATVEIDADNDGNFETTVTLEEGETWLVDGGVNVGGHIVADKPIQVELITGDKGSSFESRTVHLMPTALWSSSATTPVATKSDNATTVWLYNPHATPLSVNYIYRSNSSTLVTNSITVPAGGTGSYFRQVLTQDDSGARFIAPDGRPFYAMAAIDSNDSTYSGTSGNRNYSGNQMADWGFTLIADDALTPQALVGLGIGRDPHSSLKPTENGSPVWVTPIGNGNTPVRIYVDYDGDPSTGGLNDPHGNQYDVYYDVRELELLKIYVPGGVDQSHMLVYTLVDDVLLAVTWGQEPGKATEGEPGLDLGTGVPPLPLFVVSKDSKLKHDNDGDGYVSPGDIIEYIITIENTGRQPVTDLVVSDILPNLMEYELISTRFINQNGVTNSVSDNVEPGTTPFPLDEDGYALNQQESNLPVRSFWQVIYEIRVPDYDKLPEGVASLINSASVNGSKTSTTNSVETPLYGSIGDYAWNDANNNGLQDAGETGVAGVLVQLIDSDGEPVLNIHGNPIEAVTDESGYYRLVGVRAGNYRVIFTPPAGYMLTTPDADGLGVAGESNSVASLDDYSSPVFALGVGEAKTTLDVGLVEVAAIGDFVWLDTNDNGQQDAGESGYNGVTVKLLDGDGEPVLDANNQPITTVTASHPVSGLPGYYIFDNLYAGDYIVEFELPGGFNSFTVQNASGVDSVLDSDVDPATGRTGVISLSTGERRSDIDAGVKVALNLEKSSDQDKPLKPGDTITYTVVVQNDSGVDQENVTVTDTLPAGVTYVPDSVQAFLSGEAAQVKGEYVTETFDASGNFVVPLGVSEVVVEAWGGGGGGGRSGTGTTGSGGGGGAYASSVLGVTPGISHSVTVGAGGAAASNGGNSSFGSLVVAAGGSGSNSGGAGGTVAGSTGQTRYAGGAGGSNGSSVGGGGGGSAFANANGQAGSNGAAGGGGGSGTGNGGNGTNGNGNNGLAPGGGGGARGSNTSYNSGSGAAGRVTVTYFKPETVTVVFNASGSFTVPQSVSAIKVEAWGGGGGGFSGVGRRGGGGGGAYASSVLAVTPGTSHSVTIGQGGAAGSSGGNTTFDSNQVVAAGGGSGSGTGSGSGGTVANSTGAIRYAGGSGGARGSVTTSGGGGGGGSAYVDGTGGAGGDGTSSSGGTGGSGTGNGGAGGAPGSSGRNGVAPGGGGGGKGSGNNPTSGRGANGRLIVTWAVLGGDVGAPPMLASGWTVPAGESLTLTYEVTVDDPLVQPYLRNLASVTSTDYETPITDWTEHPVDEDYLARIGDKVWHDLNGDGLQDIGEPGITNVAVTLYRVVPGFGSTLVTNEVASTVTDSNGNYIFEKLVPGDYLVRVDVPEDSVATPQGVGADETVDSNGDQDGWSGVVSVIGGQSDYTIDFGYLYPNASIGDYVWFDADGDGLQGSGESGVAGAVVNLLHPDGTAVLRENGQPVTTTTDEDGYYLITGILPGEYVVQFVPPMGYIFTESNKNGLGIDGTTDSKPVPATGRTASFTLVDSEFKATIDAGLALGGSIGDRVWLDVNRDGFQDPGEPGYNGVAVRLLDGNGDPVLDSSGNAREIVTHNSPVTGDVLLRGG